MVSGKTLLDEQEREDYNEKSLDRYKSEEIHEKISFLAEEYVEEDINEISVPEWRMLAKKEANLVWRFDNDFKKRCKGDFEIDPCGRRALELASCVTIKQTENGE